MTRAETMGRFGIRTGAMRLLVSLVLLSLVTGCAAEEGLTIPASAVTLVDASGSISEEVSDDVSSSAEPEEEVVEPGDADVSEEVLSDRHRRRGGGQGHVGHRPGSGAAGRCDRGAQAHHHRGGL